MKKLIIITLLLASTLLHAEINIVGFCTTNPLAEECHPALIQGIQGETGETGETGQTGADGTDGKDGVDGIDGVDGVSGTDGADGEDGLDGQDAVDGDSGADGVDGEDGATGDTGENGSDGIDGVDGLDGANGTFDSSTLELLAERHNQLLEDLYRQGQDMQAGNMAVSAIDFNPDHKGHSVGWGLGTGNSYNGHRSIAGALGYQYGLTTDDEYDVSFVVKAWTTGSNAYGVGMGGVIGF